MTQPQQHGGVDSSEHVIGHHPEPRRKKLELADWIRLEDIEKAKEQKTNDDCWNRERLPKGEWSERYQLTAHFIDHNQSRVFQSGNLASVIRSPDSDSKQEDVHGDEDRNAGHLSQM